MQTSSAVSNSRLAPLPPGVEPWQESVEAALAHAFRVALPRANACVSSRLGFSSPIYARSFSHGYETLLDVARDCAADPHDVGVVLRTFEGMVGDRAGAAGSWDRVAAEMRDERALALVEHVLALPQPQREVVLLRSVGMSWRAVTRALPGRAYFSVMEDYLTALRGVWSRADDLVTRTAH